MKICKKQIKVIYDLDMSYRERLMCLEEKWFCFRVNARISASKTFSPCQASLGYPMPHDALALIIQSPGSRDFITSCRLACAKQPTDLLKTEKQRRIQYFFYKLRLSQSIHYLSTKTFYVDFFVTAKDGVENLFICAEEFLLFNLILGRRGGMCWDKNSMCTSAPTDYCTHGD